MVVVFGSTCSLVRDTTIYVQLYQYHGQLNSPSEWEIIKAPLRQQALACGIGAGLLAVVLLLVGVLAWQKITFKP